MIHPVASFRILTVCLGNVCRSPLAERLLAVRLSSLGVGAFEVSSAGTHGLTGQPMEPNAAAQLITLGGDPAGFVARRLDAHMVERADLVLTATVRIRQSVLQVAPTALRRTFTLLEFAELTKDSTGEAADSPSDLVADAARRRASVSGVDLDVPDPMGMPVSVHEKSARLAADAVGTIAAALARVA